MPGKDKIAAKIDNFVSVQADLAKPPDIFINNGTGTPFK
jgi:hypothetical protein